MNTIDTTYPPVEGHQSSNQDSFSTEIFPNTAPLIPCKVASMGLCSVSEACLNIKSNSNIKYASSTAAFPRRWVRQGESLYRAGDALINLYQLYTGSAKLRTITCVGTEQVAEFPMAGALLGLDGIETGKYTCDAIALEDSMVRTIPFFDLLARCNADTETALRLNKAMAQETNHYRHLLLVLASMNSEERIASFLLDISERMATYGYSSREFVLKMTRADIACHLGMKLETVSRTFTRLQAAHILDVDRRHLNIRDHDALRKLGMGR